MHRRAAPPTTWLPAIGHLPRGAFTAPTMHRNSGLDSAPGRGAFRWAVRCHVREEKFNVPVFVSSGKIERDDHCQWLDLNEIGLVGLA